VFGVGFLDRLSDAGSENYLQHTTDLSSIVFRDKHLQPMHLKVLTGGWGSYFVVATLI